MILAFIFLFFVLMLLAATFTIAWDKLIGGKSPQIGIPEPTLSEIIQSIQIKPGDIFYDLGCGDARVLLAAAKHQPSAKYIGIEKAIVPFLLARYATRKNRNIQILHGDIRKIQTEKNATVFCYLLPILLAELNLNTKRVVSVEYPLAHRKPSKTIILKNASELISRVYFYRQVTLE